MNAPRDTRHDWILDVDYDEAFSVACLALTRLTDLSAREARPDVISAASAIGKAKTRHRLAEGFDSKKDPDPE